MRFFTARSLALAALVPALLLFAFVPGCAKQSEGERCGDPTYGADSEDCDDGLVCVNFSLLLSEADGTHRCCYPDRVTNSRCEPKGTSSTPGGSGGGGGSGTAGSGAAAGSVAAEAGVGGEGG